MNRKTFFLSIFGGLLAFNMKPQSAKTCTKTYHLDTGMFNEKAISSFIVLKGIHSQEEADRIARKIIAAHTGDGKRGRTVII